MITKPWSNHYNKPILHFPQQLIDPHPLSLSLSIPFSFFIFIVHFWLPLKALRENRTKKWETEWKDLFFFHSRLGVSLNQALMLLFNDNNSSNNLEDQSHHQLIITKALLEQVLVNSFISNFHKSTSACCMHWWGLFNFFILFCVCVKEIEKRTKKVYQVMKAWRVHLGCQSLISLLASTGCLKASKASLNYLVSLI